MDIKGISSAVVGSRLSEQTKNPEKSGEAMSSNKGNATHADKVTLTSLSKTQNLEAKTVASNVDNSTKIAAIKTAINNGSYQINAESIANKLMQTEALVAGA